MIGGSDGRQYTCKHPVLGDFTFFPKAGEDGKYFPGGLTTEDDNASATGSGLHVQKKTMKLAYYETAPIINDALNEIQIHQLQTLSASTIEGTWTLEMNSGSTLSGTGMPVGDLIVNTTDGNIDSFKIMFSGKVIELGA